MTVGIRADYDHTRDMGKTSKSHATSPSEVQVTQEPRGREQVVDPTTIEPRGKSKDLLSSFESRVTRMEETMSGMDAHLDDLSQRVEGLEVEGIEV